MGRIDASASPKRGGGLPSLVLLLQKEDGWELLITTWYWAHATKTCIAKQRAIIWLIVSTLSLMTCIFRAEREECAPSGRMNTPPLYEDGRVAFRAMAPSHH